MTPGQLFAVTALAVSLFTFYKTYSWRQTGRERDELREHFDCDVRDLVHESLKEFLSQRRKIIECLGALRDTQVTAQKRAEIANKIDLIRDIEVGATLYEISQRLLFADEQYGSVLPAVYRDGVSIPISHLLLGQCDDRYDGVMRALSDVIAATRYMTDGNGLPNTAVFNEAVFSYEAAAREYLNELRTRIGIGKPRSLLPR